jgi:hypothetical protein
LLLVAGEAGAAKAEELDGRLIALCREFADAEVTFAAWDAKRDFMPFDHPLVKETNSSACKGSMCAERPYGKRRNLREYN